MEMERKGTETKEAQKGNRGSSAAVVVPFRKIRETDRLIFDPRYHILKAYVQADVLGFDHLADLLGDCIPLEMVQVAEIIEFKMKSSVLSGLISLKISTDINNPSFLEYREGPWKAAHHPFHQLLIGKTVEIDMYGRQYYVSMIEPQEEKARA